MFLWKVNIKSYNKRKERLILEGKAGKEKGGLMMAILDCQLD
jgi:hypothetical protein